MTHRIIKERLFASTLMVVLAVLFSILTVGSTVGSLVGSADADMTQTQEIAGGQVSKDGAWPWIVSLRLAEANSDMEGHDCGGSIIAPRWVLTAAHCVVEDGVTIVPSDIMIVMGKNTLSDTDGTTIKVSRIIVHASYDEYMTNNDIALLELAQSVTVTPVKLIGQSFVNQLVLPGTMTTTIGWGATPTANMSDDLLEVQVPVISREACEQRYKQDDPLVEITDAMICAGYEDGSKDTCPGDSGGPLLINGSTGGSTQNDWIQAGIVSWGPNAECGAGYYGVYTDVAHFAEWIKQNTCTSTDIPSAPSLQVAVNGNAVTVSWNKTGAENYRLYYAAVKDGYNGVYMIDTGTGTGLAATLPSGSQYYVAAQAYTNTCYSAFSNIELIQVK